MGDLAYSQCVDIVDELKHPWDEVITTGIAILAAGVIVGLVTVHQGIIDRDDHQSSSVDTSTIVTAPGVPVAPVDTAQVSADLSETPSMQQASLDLDVQFLATLRRGTTGWTSPDGAYIQWGRWVCQSLGSGHSISSAVKLFTDPPDPWGVDSAKFFVKIAITVYCPQYV